ncbi:DnaJ domain-containing protein [Glomus cerebriforme]|uniref:DnaJ domain-containing protein n=1 Tax=Glomus cerebriforme TaxID=658196 RepID=A0A397TG35_9GLOM|nr:DnaJ domain-containing protein [Glomus cerebriforme]
MTYYETLGIDADATEDDIRKAYRKQALLWHPDKNVQRKEEAEEKFKLISEAYEVLSDTEKRRIYDLYGEEGLKNNGPSYDNYDHGSRPHFPFQFHDPRDIFNTFFGGRDPFAEMLGQQFFGTGFASPFMPGFGMTSAGAGPRSRSFDPFFSDFGNFGGSGTSSSSSFSFSSNSFSGGGRGGFVKKSTRTQIVNGVRTTVTTTEDAQVKYNI